MEKIRRLILPGALTVLAFSALLLGLLTGRDRIVEGLKPLSPAFLEINFALFFLLLVPGARDLIKPFAAIPGKAWLPVAAVALLAFGLAFFAAPRTHRIYYDENIYLHIGQSVALTNRAEMVNFGEMRGGRMVVRETEYNKEPNAYPVFLSFFYRVFGCSENLSFLLNNILFGLSSLHIFGIGFLLGGRFRIGLAGAGVFAVIPQNILWHNTTSVEPANTFFIVLTVFIFLAFLKSGSSRLFFLAAAAACLAAQFRLESLLIFPLLAVMGFLGEPRIFRKWPALVYAAPMILLLLLPHILHLSSFAGHSWGSGQNPFSIFNVRHNLATNGLFFLDNRDFPALLTFFLALSFFGKGFLKAKIGLLFWLVFFWGVFLFFYAGSYYYGADVRFVLMALPPFSLLAGMGFFYFDRILKKFFRKDFAPSAAIIAVIFFSVLPRARAVGEEAWAARADHRYAQVMADALPLDSIVFTHNPNMFLFWGRSSAQASILAGYDEARLRSVEASFPGGVFFHYNFWCNVSDPVQQGFCKGILEKFPHEEVLKFREREYTYILYKIH